jgi:hypothetical protein
MNSKTVSIIVLTVALASLSMVGISNNISYVMASQGDSYKNQGQCMKEQREDGVDKKTYKQTCKAIDFNDKEDDCVDSDEVLCDDGGDSGDGVGNGDDDIGSGNNEDNHGCPNNHDGICH